MRTYQGRLSLDAQASDALEAYGALFGRAVRTLYANRRRNRELAKPEFMRLFDLTSRQYNAVKFTLDGMEASIRELRPGRIANLKHRIAAVIAKIDKASRPAKIATEVTPHRLVKIDADMSRLASTERNDRGKAQSGRRKAILADGRLRVRIVRERETNPFNRVGIPGANRRQDAFGRRRESHDSWIPKHCNKCLWYQER